MKEIYEKIYCIDSGLGGNITTIMVGVHGDETSGIYALDSLLGNIRINSGKVYFIYANPEAIKKSVRCTEKNLNRCFLKNKTGETYEEKRALIIMKILDKSDFLLDIHNTISKNSSLKMLITTHTDYDKFFDIENIVTNIDDIHKGGSDGYMDNIGKKGFCIECGSINFGDKSKSLILAKKSIINFLKITKNTSGFAEIYKLNRKIIKMKYIYKVKTNSFIFRKEFKDFEEIKKGGLIAIDGEVKILAKYDCAILFAYSGTKIGEEGFCVGII